MKRLFDIIVAIFLLLLVSPLLLIVLALVKFTSPGSVFYRQSRVGQYCLPFNLYKIRSMVVDADQSGQYQTTADDQRITPIGRFIRKTSLDELPQLWNVLKGDMSLVGPRPDVPQQEALYTAEDWQQRHVVRPGITGLAQALFRSSATPAERLAKDLEYAQQSSLMLDIKILFLTAKQLIHLKGSN